MVTNVVSKSLAGAEDILRGVDAVSQIRNGQAYEVNQLHAPVAVSTTEIMSSINPAVTTRVDVIDINSFTPYIYSSTNTSGITSLFGGSWLVYDSSTLTAQDGILNRVAKPVTWKGFAGGADSTGTNDSLAAFNAANASKHKIYIPSGLYRLSADVVSDKDTSWEFEQAVSFTGPGRLRQVPWNAGLGNNIFQYLEFNSRNTCIAPADGIGIYGSAHTADGGDGGAGLAVAGMAYNDDTSGARSSVWALYGTTVRNAGTIGASHGLELDIANRGDEREMFPNAMFPNGQTDALWLASGGELAGNGVLETLNAASCAIGVISNDKTLGTPARFLKGLVFASNSLKGTDGDSTGQGVAIAFGNRHSMTWYNNTNQKTAEIFSTLEDATKSLRLTFTDFGLQVNRLSSGLPLFSVETGPTTPANYIAVRSQATATPPAVAAAGSDTDISLRLSPKGTGVVLVDSNITPRIANTNTVGTAAAPWSGGFTQTAFTITSGAKYKTEPLDITDAMLDALAECPPIQYKLLDRIETKGEDKARWHYGNIAERLAEAFERHGLDVRQYAFFCEDFIEYAAPVFDEETGEVLEPEVLAETRLGVRYEELLMLEAALHRRNYARLEKRIKALESK